jgi:glycosyltransferase involved in cell wall biosynthesis
MLTLPTFSIITPSFRQLHWLRLCAASVADQGSVEHEHIVQDAGTGPELELWAQTVPNLSLYVEKDQGMYDAVNRGLKRARGTICSYLNCDEQLLSNALGQVAAFFDKNPEIDVLFGDSILISEGGEPLSYRRTVVPILSYVEHVQLNAPTCATFFRRSIIDRGLLFNPHWRAIGDQVWIGDLIRAGVRMATLRKPLAVFTFTGENLGATAISKQESARHRSSVPRATDLRTTVEVIWHRVRKSFAGAYWPRQVDIEIYTLESPSARRRQSARVGFSWPRYASERSTSSTRTSHEKI